MARRRLALLSGALHPLGPAFLFAAALLAPATTARPQSTLQPKPITTPVRDAGTFNMATGTWTRASQVPALQGAFQLYDNTCQVGYYCPVPWGLDVKDSGRIPTAAQGGLADCYEIQGFQLAYCTYEEERIGVDLHYYTCFESCSDAYGDLCLPSIAFQLANLPGGASGGGQACWLVAFDLRNTTRTFGLYGDSWGVFDDDPNLDHFSWTFGFATPLSGEDGGPLVAGDPLQQLPTSAGICAGFGGGLEGQGTDHPGWGPSTGPGSGIGQLDRLGISCYGPSGCFWFGGYDTTPAQNPLASLYHKLWGEPGTECLDLCVVCDLSSTSFCWADQGNCPGGAVGHICAGCPHQAGPNGTGGARLSGYGSAQFSNDSFGLRLTHGPSSLGIVIQGANAISYPSGNPNLPDSSGLFCVSPQMRGNVEFTDLGPYGDEALIDDFQGMQFSATAEPPGDTTFYQFWFRDNMNPNANPGPNVEFNFSNAVEVAWIN